MDLLVIILSITAIIYGVFGFIVVKRYSKRWGKSRHVIEHDEKLQKEFRKESKKIVVMITANIILIVLLNLIFILLRI